jgi:hypothetical protein
MNGPGRLLEKIRYVLILEILFYFSELKRLKIINFSFPYIEYRIALLFDLPQALQA